jgi:hypothetical protein
MRRRTHEGPLPTSAARRAFPLPARRVSTFAAAVVTVLALPGWAAAAPPALPWPDAAKIAFAGPFRDTEVFSLSPQQNPGVWGGPHTTSRGETVTVYASVAYPQDPARTHAWAEYLSSLVHGSELPSVSLSVAPLDEVQDVCGRGAFACYSPAQRAIFAPGEAPEPDVSAEAIIAHEYGHHVAANRSNDPWPAIDWGTKRWATYVRVCGRQQAGELYPGDQRDFYRLNPGEGFAESYRLLNQTRLGITPSPWDVVDQLLYPDAQALALVAQDVEQPWATTTPVTVTGRVTRKAPRSTKTIATPLDGSVRVTLRVPAKSRLTLQLSVPSSGRVIARTTASAPFTATIRTTACGQRSLRARVTALKGAGTYRLTIARP